MAEIHRKEPIIKKRMTTFSPKEKSPKKEPIHKTLLRGLGIMGRGALKVGKAVYTEANKYEWSGRIDERGYMTHPKKARRKTKRKFKRR